MDFSEHKEKLLSFLEREYDSLNDKNEHLTNRASVTATLLTGFAFFVLSDEKIKNAVISIPCLNICVCVVTALMVLFCLSMGLLMAVLFLGKSFQKWNFFLLYFDMFVNYDSELPEDSQQYYIEQLIFICDNNRKVLNRKAVLYNISMILLMFIVVIFFFYC